MLAASRNMYERKSKPFDQPCLNAVIATRRDVTSRSLHHFAQGFSFFGCCRFHITFPFLLLWILTQWLARSWHPVGFSDSDICPAKARRAPSSDKYYFFSLRPLRLFVIAQSMLCGIYPIFVVPLLPRSGLRGKYCLSSSRTSAHTSPGYLPAAALGSGVRTSSPAFTLCMS